MPCSHSCLRAGNHVDPGSVSSGTKHECMCMSQTLRCTRLSASVCPLIAISKNGRCVEGVAYQDAEGVNLNHVSANPRVRDESLGCCRSCTSIALRFHGARSIPSPFGFVVLRGIKSRRSLFEAVNLGTSDCIGFRWQSMTKCRSDVLDGQRRSHDGPSPSL